MSAQTFPVGFHDARLSVPVPSEGALDRPRVTQRLDEAIRGRHVVLVTGAVGTGKTYAVALWSRSSAASPEPMDTAWASLDRADRDPHRFWLTVVGSLQGVLDAETVADLAVPFRPNQYFVDSLTEALSRVHRPVVLVLDDVQEISGSRALSLLQHLQRALPRHHRLVLISRQEPMLHLHRLRLAGDLGEMRASELAFTPSEAAELLREGGHEVSGETLDHLMRRTEGWAAGLRLAMVASEPDDTPGKVAQVADRPTLVTSYLHEEVFAALSRGRADFLMRTSIVDRVCAPLAQALTQEPSPGAVLESLVADNMLVSELGGTGWYCYHPMLLEMLRARLRSEPAELTTDLHRRAQRWFEESGEWLESLRHAFLTGNQAGAVQLALRSAAMLAFTPERARLAQALTPHLGGPRWDGDPEHQVCRALAAHGAGDDEAATVWARRAEPGLGTLPEPRRGIASIVLHLIFARLAQGRGDAQTMRAAAQEAFLLAGTLEPGASTALPQLQSIAESMMGIGDLWLGRQERAEELLRSSIAALDHREYGAHAGAHRAGMIALSEAVRGRVRQGRRRAEAVLESAQASGWSQSHESGAAWLALAVASQLRAEVPEAERCLALARKTQIQLHDPLLGVVMNLVSAHGALNAGDVPRTRRSLAEVDRWLAEHPRLTVMTVMRGMLGAETHLAVGAPAAASAVLDDLDAQLAEAGASFGTEPDPVVITRGYVYLSTGQPQRAQDVVAPLLSSGGGIGSEAWLITALAQDRLRLDSSAMESIARALAYGEAEDAVQGFLRAGERLPVLLRRHLDVLGSHRDFAGKVLTRIDCASATGHGQEVDRAGVVTLTEREQSVLTYLPTLSTNTEIADQLNISVNTVKQHLKSINRKLGVGSRREAVRAARRLGLLADEGERRATVTE